MSLLKEFARPCTIMVKSEVVDGEGGRYTEWVDGDSFENYQAIDNSAQTTRAEQEGLERQYTVLTDQSVALSYGDFFRDDITGATYKVISEPSDEMSPGCATFCLKHYRAEKRELPT